jgi:hypothetical protein
MSDLQLKKSDTVDSSYDKMANYIESIFNVFQLVNRKANNQKDKRLKMISLMIYNYVRKIAKDNDVDLKEFKEPESINLIPVFEYIFQYSFF